MAKNNMTEGRLMKNDRLKKYTLICLTLLAGNSMMRGQDQIPDIVFPEIKMCTSILLNEFKNTPDTIVTLIGLPLNFKNTDTNRIIDKANVLKPIIERLHWLKVGASDDTLRIVHIGDSHVRGRIFPQTAGSKLNETFNGLISYTEMGVNGATCLTFTHPARIEAIVEKKPELLIVSFGTNESHNRRYSSVVHYHQMDELMKLLRERLPEIPVLLTTPPGSYESFRQRNRRRTYAVNPRTVAAVNTICTFAQETKLAVWNIYDIAGGRESACHNWWNTGLMRPDHVHYLPDAYVLQGELLYEALIKAYNDYVSE